MPHLAARNGKHVLTSRSLSTDGAEVLYDATMPTVARVHAGLGDALLPRELGEPYRL
jgi:hypothetical protein